jgi:hypothetical protein
MFAGLRLGGIADAAYSSKNIGNVQRKTDQGIKLKIGATTCG